MSMKIGDNYQNYLSEYSEKVQLGKEKTQSGMGKTQGIENSVDNNAIPVPRDEYISSEKSGNKPSGLYRMGQDENGNPKVLYDDPKKAEKQSGSQPMNKSEECTTNTDAVDREIEKLKEEKRQIEQQIQTASDEDKVKELEKKLAQVEAELSQKDNDIYRRQNAIVS